MDDLVDNFVAAFFIRVSFAIGLFIGSFASTEAASIVAGIFIVVAVIGGLRGLHKWSREP